MNQSMPRLNATLDEVAPAAGGGYTIVVTAMVMIGNDPENANVELHFGDSVDKQSTENGRCRLKATYTTQASETRAEITATIAGRKPLSKSLQVKFPAPKPKGPGRIKTISEVHSDDGQFVEFVFQVLDASGNPPQGGGTLNVQDPNGTLVVSVNASGTAMHRLVWRDRETRRSFFVSLDGSPLSVTKTTWR